jgi:beta-lactamase class A
MGLVRTIIAALLLLIGSAAWAQATPSAQFRTRAEGLVGLFNGKTKAEALFSSAFLAQVPAARLDVLSRQLKGQLGAARSVAKIEASSPTSGTLSLAFERGTLQLRMSVGTGPPHLIEGLLVTGTQIKGDSLTAVIEEMRKLRGQTSLAVARLGDAAPVTTAAHETARPLAIGSTFKLFLLAELSRSIAAGERKWTDVASLDRRSLPSGFLHTWPAEAPMTLHSLAALMISQSDNSATDTLLHLLGRERVEQILPALGIAAPERNRPFLSTLEAFALKAGTGEAAAGWAGADEAKRRSLLSGYSNLSPEQIDLEKLGGPPRQIDTIEWFASADDLVRTMDWLRRNGDKEAMEILAINPGIGKAAADELSYLGYKGGSETGVMHMAFLVRSKAGQWFAVAGGWNDKEASVDEAGFAALMSRVVALLR